MEHKPVQDVLEEAVHMGFEDEKKWNTKELLQGFGFVKSFGQPLACGAPFMGEIVDITNPAYLEGSPRSAVAGRRKVLHTESDGSEIAHYKQFVRELEDQGAADSIRKAKWPAEKNVKLKQRMVQCVANVVQEVQTKCHHRSAELDAKGVYSAKANQVRTNATYVTDLLRKLRMGGLKREAVVLVEGPDEQGIPQALRSLQTKGDSFESMLDKHLEEMQRPDLPPEPEISPPSKALRAERRSSLNRRKSSLGMATRTASRTLSVVSALNGRKKSTAAKLSGLSNKRPSVQSKGEAAEGKKQPHELTAAELQGEPVADEASEAVEEQQPSAPGSEPSLSHEEPVAAEVAHDLEMATGAAEEEQQEMEEEEMVRTGKAANEDSWSLNDLEKPTKDSLNKRRRRRKRLPPDYIEYAQLRQKQLDEADARAAQVSPWVRDSDESRRQLNSAGGSMSPERGKKGSSTSVKPSVMSPLDRLSNDVLMTKHKRAELAQKVEWQEVPVSKHVVLRTSLPSAAPRVPQLVMSAVSDETVQSLDDVDSSWLLSGNKTGEMKSLISDIYAKESSAVISEFDLLPGAAPADFNGFEQQSTSAASKGYTIQFDQKHSHTVQATMRKPNHGGGGRMPSIDIPVQRRLELVWDSLEVKPMEKLDHVLKYGRPDFAALLEPSLAVWEKAAHSVTRRETLLRELNNLKNSSSAVNGSVAVGERMQRLAVAVCEQTKDCLQLSATLLDDYADILKYRGLAYHSKMRRDLDSELISLLPVGYDVEMIVGFEEGA